jgi:hypothetical protein
MDKVTIGLASVFFVFAAEAHAQSVPNRVTNTVGGAGSVAGGAIAGPTASSVVNPANGALSGSAAGGALPGAVEFKAGEKIIQFRGTAGMGDDRGNFKAGLGIPF